MKRYRAYKGGTYIKDLIFYLVVFAIVVGAGAMLAEGRELDEPYALRIAAAKMEAVEESITPEEATIQEKTIPGKAPTPTPERTYLGKLQIYGYDPFCDHCCGKSNGVTASGKVATIGKTVAMSGYPFGTEIYIEGLGYYTVEDRGVGTGVVDVACEDHTACYAITGKYDVYIVE